jgi:ferric-dicitrate binding protein FerR (iron transport regulator)
VQAESEQKAGEVSDVKGEAFAEKNSVRRDLEREAPLFIRDQIGTGAASRLTMRLGRDTILRLGERARLVIDRYLVDAGGEINLEAGPMLFDRSVGAPPASLQIRSLFGLIAVRGTRFFAGPSNGVFGVFVERGSVTVSAAGQQVALSAGQGTNVRWPGAAPTRPAQWRNPRIREALDSVT